MTPHEETEHYLAVARARIQWLLWVMDLPWYRRIPVWYADKLGYWLITHIARPLGWR